MSFRDRIGLEYPVVQAGMGGGIATGALAGEVSAAGGLGTVGTLPPQQLERELRQARERAGRAPVAVNLLVPFVGRAHIEAAKSGGARVAVLHAGLTRALIEQLKVGGLFVLATVGKADEAKRALDHGADGVVLQGIEAGGHLVGVEPALQVLPRVVEATVGAPVLLAGGIANREDVRRALEVGADAVVAGTRFLLTHESAAHEAYKSVALRSERTIETLLFGLGWPMRHRVVPNAATDRWCRDRELGPRAVVALYRLSTPLRRLPLSLTNATARNQRRSIPLFSPAPPLQGMPDHVVEASALYAGESALRIDSVVTAAEAVRLLAHQSPTIPPAG